MPEDKSQCYTRRRLAPDEKRMQQDQNERTCPAAATSDQVPAAESAGALGGSLAKRITDQINHPAEQLHHNAKTCSHQNQAQHQASRRTALIGSLPCAAAAALLAISHGRLVALQWSTSAQQHSSSTSHA